MGDRVDRRQAGLDGLAGGVYQGPKRADRSQRNLPRWRGAAILRRAQELRRD